MMGEPSQPNKILNMNQATNNNRGTDVQNTPNSQETEVPTNTDPSQNTLNSQETEVPTINKPLLLEISGGFRSRGPSVSSFFSTMSGDSQTAMETTPQEQDDKTVVTWMHEEIEKMVKATARQKNI